MRETQKEHIGKEKDISSINGVNLGHLYLPAQSIDESPVFSQNPDRKTFIDPTLEPIHAALIVIRLSQQLDDQLLSNVARTLSQLAQLGMQSIVVVETGDPTGRPTGCTWRQDISSQVDRVAGAIDQIAGQRARRVDGILRFEPSEKVPDILVQVKGQIQIHNRDLLIHPLRRDTIPVVAPIGVSSTQRLTHVNVFEVVLAIIRELIGITSKSRNAVERTIPGDFAAKKLDHDSRTVSLDRIIILDSKGGIPPSGPLQRPHVFINLEQEYDEIARDLQSAAQSQTLDEHPWPGMNPESEYNEGLPENPAENGKIDCASSTSHHLSNLQLVRDSLSLLPPASSALITSPQAVARSEARIDPSSPPGVGTRPQRNILIHNLLTDKPVFSSSLPNSRLAPSAITSTTSLPPTTFVKRGMPLTILPDPRANPWTIPDPNAPPSLFLNDPRLDIPRLVHLIEDSFGRPLDQQKYFSRIAPSIAGIIIAGSYEGGAILTWERPPDAPSNDNSRLVPYLDKFAVLKRSQGSGGVADVVFSAMVRECFPNGVCWRSRSDNPVNKWYFERAKGHWRLDGYRSQEWDGNGSMEETGVKKDKKQSWTMFWTTENVDCDTWADYEGVCGSIGTSWADNKKILD